MDSSLEMMIRSEPERHIARMLDNLGMAYEYLQEVKIPSEDGKTQPWYPEFLIVNEGIAVEYIHEGKVANGQFPGRPQVYLKGGYHVLPIYYDEMKDIQWKLNFSKRWELIQAEKAAKKAL